MAVANTKKAQTLINLCADAALQLQALASTLETYRALYVANNVNPAGTALAGNVPAVSAWIDKVQSAAADPVTAGLIAARVETHRNQALEG